VGIEMNQAYLSAKEAAIHLGISTATLYGWLGESDRGLLLIRGQSVTIEYFQSGRKGQGRIQIEPCEVGRIRDLMRVHPQRANSRRPPIQQVSFPGITAPLGHPNRHM